MYTDQILFEFILYLFYGLAFFTMGVTIAIKDTHVSKLGIAGILWLLATFGFIHGLHEWFELYLFLSNKLGIFRNTWQIQRLFFVGGSFIILLCFAFSLNYIASVRVRNFFKSRITTFIFILPILIISQVYFYALLNFLLAELRNFDISPKASFNFCWL